MISKTLIAICIGVDIKIPFYIDLKLANILIKTAWG